MLGAVVVNAVPGVLHISARDPGGRDINAQLANTSHVVNRFWVSQREWAVGGVLEMEIKPRLWKKVGSKICDYLKQREEDLIFCVLYVEAQQYISYRKSVFFWLMHGVRVCANRSPMRLFLFYCIVFLFSLNSSVAIPTLVLLLVQCMMYVSNPKTIHV